MGGAALRLPVQIVSDCLVTTSDVCKYKITAFIQRFCNKWPLKAFCLSLHIQTPTAVSAMQGDSCSSRAVMARCPAQGHLDTQLGGAGTSNLPVTSRPALPPATRRPMCATAV